MAALLQQATQLRVLAPVHLATRGHACHHRQALPQAGVSVLVRSDDVSSSVPMSDVATLGTGCPMLEKIDLQGLEFNPLSLLSVLEHRRMRSLVLSFSELKTDQLLQLLQHYVWQPTRASLMRNTAWVSAMMVVVVVVWTRMRGRQRSSTVLHLTRATSGSATNMAQA